MLSPLLLNMIGNESETIDLLYKLCRDNEIEKLQTILPSLGHINIIDKFHSSIGSTCLHVACYYGHRTMVRILLEYGAMHSVRNLRHNLTPYEETQSDDIKQLFIEQQTKNNDYDYIEWSMRGDDLLTKRREFRHAIDVYKTYDNHHLISKLLAEVIHYYLNEYLTNQNLTSNDDQSIRKQIETIEGYFKDAIEKQDYLTYFVKAYTLTNFFYKVLNKDLALYVLEYFDQTKVLSTNSRLVNCLVHLVTLLIYHPNLPHYRYQGICYRGMRITKNDLNQYQLNQHILNRAFLSTSLDRNVAEMFAGEGQQNQMRYTPEGHSALQYSCICRYIIKQNSTAIDIQNLSTKPDEKEILIIPFSVFKVTAIKRNYLVESSARISIEIELEECEDPEDNDRNENENDQVTKLLPAADTQTYFSSRLQKCLWSIIGLMIVATLFGAVSIYMYRVVTIPSRHEITHNTTSIPEIINNNNEDYLPSGCPIILNRSTWNARPFKSRGDLKALPVTHIIIRQLSHVKSMMKQSDCIKALRSLQDELMDNKGWADIDYSFFICNDNDDQHHIYRGRGWTYIGAHCIGYNFKSLGITVIGNSTNERSMKTFKSLIQCGISKNIIAQNFTFVGHVSSKDLYKSYLEYLRNDVDFQYIGTQIFCGTP